MEPDYSPAVALSFIILLFGLLFLVLTGYRLALKNSGLDTTERRRKVRMLMLPLLFWLLVLAKVSGMKFFHDWTAMPPRLMIAVLPPLLFAILLMRSGKVTRLLENIPHQWLIFIQSFRILMELILWKLFMEQLIPVQMTFEGSNFDIFSGILALPVAYLALRKKASLNLIMAYNIIGLLLLANILVIAILSAPLPVRMFMNEPSNTIVAYFPFVWLPGFVVPVAYTMHFLSLKKCIAEKRRLGKFAEN